MENEENDAISLIDPDLQPRPEDEATRQAWQAADELTNAQATEVVRALIALSPGNEALYGILAWLRALNGENEEAQALAQERFRIMPSADSALVLTNLARFHGDETEERYWFGHAQRLDPDHGMVLSYLLQEQRAAKNWGEAIRTAERARVLYPHAIGAYERRYNLARLMEDHEGAKRMLDEAPEWFRQRSVYHQLRAKDALSRKEFAEAEREAREAIAITPHKSSALALLARVLRQMELLDEAASFALRAVESTPSNLEALQLLRSIAHHQGKSEEASEWTRRIALFAPAKSLASVFQTAIDMFKSGNMTAADLELRRIINEEKRPLVVKKARRHLIASLTSERHWKEARREFDAARELGQVEVALNMYEFAILVHEGKIDDSRAMMEKLLAQPNAPWEMYGEIVAFLIDTGERMRAESLLNTMIEKLPAPAAMCKSVRSLELAGHKPEARRLYQAVRANFPDYTTATIMANRFEPYLTPIPESSKTLEGPFWKRLFSGASKK